jgi:hypothetical protein
MAFGKLKVSQIETESRTVNVNDLQTSAQVQSAISSLVNGAPGALDTLNELAASLGNDANFATTVTNQIAAVQATAASKASLGLSIALG